MRQLSAGLGAAALGAVGLALAAPARADSALDAFAEQASFLIRQKLDLHLVRSSDLEALVALRFAADGQFVDAVVEERSGDAGFDLALESAVRRSVPALARPPLPSPPGAPFTVRLRFRSVP
jgi:hypothetical protein